MLAKAELIGRITKDLELKKTTNGKSVVNFSLACDVGFGEHKSTTFMECVAWNNLADNLVSYQEKGSLIRVYGDLKTRSYEVEGSKRYITEVIVDNILYLPSNKSNSQQNNFEQANTSQSDKVAQNGSNDFLSDLDITDEQLPF